MSAQLRIQLFDRLVNRNNGTALRVIQLHAWGITGIDDAGRMQDLRMDSALAHDWMPGDPALLARQDPARLLGCLLAGAAGDALGAAVEFSNWDSIRRQYGELGIRDMAPAYGRLGAITDDTQMMLFTAEGLIRASVRGTARGICDPSAVVHHALLRWLLTQNLQPATKVGRDGWLIKQPELWSRRAPGNTCLTALSASSRFGEPATNNSKGCGGVMRVAPCAIFSDAFELASESAHYSHGHPSGYLAAGLFADILHRLWTDCPTLEQACHSALQKHGQRPGMEETRQAVEYVLEQYHQGNCPTPERIDRYGGGWIAEEALAIGIWCALCADSLEDGIIRAVNHSGDSDSTGLIAGNLLGLIHGPAAIPGRWLAELELREIITRIAADLLYVPVAYDGGDNPEVDHRIWERYPGW
jgi:ADP-ribosylglycohydrolase